MRNPILPAIVALLSAGTVAGAILLRPTDFDRCLKTVSTDIYRQGGTATLDPKDVEAQAARICSDHGAR